MRLRGESISECIIRVIIITHLKRGLLLTAWVRIDEGCCAVGSVSGSTFYRAAISLMPVMACSEKDRSRNSVRASLTNRPPTMA